MTATMTFSVGAPVSFEYQPTESSFWKEVGKRLLDIAIPNHIIITSDHGTAELQVIERGSYIENGIKKPSMYVSEVINNVCGLAPSAYKKAYLTCVHPESNNYKAYILRPSYDGIYADYGSIDEVAQGRYRTVKSPYETYLYWIRYYEKLSKGYVDQTDILLNKKPTRNSSSARSKSQNPESETAEIPDSLKANAELYSMLTAYARHFVDEVLSAPHAFTERQVAECRKLWNKLGGYKTVSGFNRCLEKLIVLSPRKRNPMEDNVSRFFAKTKDDFPRIINYEERLILAMEGAIGKTTVTKRIEGVFNGIEVYEANDEQKAEVMQCLGTSELRKKVRRIWRVKPLAQEKRLADYVKRCHIKTIKRFWHGSRNENWASIIQTGLSLNPNALITGKMFGQGIYFAPSPSKSFGYTSYKGTRWARGRSENGILGLYATAYGRPYLAHTGGYGVCQEMRQHGCNCVHATPANTGLHQDEVVFYSEDAMVLNYLVEFGD